MFVERQRYFIFTQRIQPFENISWCTADIVEQNPPAPSHRRDEFGLDEREGNLRFDIRLDLLQLGDRFGQSRSVRCDKGGHLFFTESVKSFEKVDHLPKHDDLVGTELIEIAFECRLVLFEDHLQR